MKVLTHEGALVTLPFSLRGLKDNEFERVDGKGGSEVGIVAEQPEAAVRRAVSGAEDSYSTPREMMSDIRFIAGALANVEVGAEVWMQKNGDRISLEVPQTARAPQATGRASRSTAARAPRQRSTPAAQSRASKATRPR